jgi:hypothetical protein
LHLDPLDAKLVEIERRCERMQTLAQLPSRTNDDRRMGVN